MAADSDICSTSEQQPVTVVKCGTNEQMKRDRDTHGGGKLGGSTELKMERP